jgi:sugar lactone lactonase YvrE
VAKEYSQQFLVPGSWFHGVHGLAFNKDDQLFAGSVVGQTIYRVQVDSGEVDRVIDPPTGMADDIAFADDGTMAWTAFLLGKVYIRKPNGKTIEVAQGLSGPNSLAFGKDGRLFVTEVFLGDALYEVDLKNVDKPDFKPFARNELRRVAEKMGGLNGFEIHKDDGFLYGPIWFKGEIVKVNLETGASEVIASGFKIPAAANIDPQNRDNIYVVDTGTGGIWSVSLTSKAKRLVASMKPGLDNLAFDSRGRLFVTSMTDNGVYHGRQADRGVAHHRRGQARGPCRSRRDDRRTARRRCTWRTCSAIATVGGTSGAVTDVLRVHGETHAYPIRHLGRAQARRCSRAGSPTPCEKIDRKTGKLVATLGEFAAPVDAVEVRRRHDVRGRAGDGQPREGECRRQGRAATVDEGAARARWPWSHGAGTADLRHRDFAAGVVTEIDVADGRAQGGGGQSRRPRRHRCRSGRQALRRRGRPEARRRDRSGDRPRRSVIASNLDIGLAPFPGGPPALVPTGVAVEPLRCIVYVSADIRNCALQVDAALVGAFQRVLTMAGIPFIRDFKFDYGTAMEVTPLIRRVVANNPNPFTFKGTGTYIIGHGKVAVVDPGPDQQEHIDAVLRALRGETVTHILVTHTHIDHVPATPALARATGAKVYSYGPHPEPPEGDHAEEPGDLLLRAGREAERRRRDPGRRLERRGRPYARPHLQPSLLRGEGGQGAALG